MNLIVPGVGTEAGPTYAFDVNSSLTLIDQHDHSPGKGVLITPSGLNINSTLTFNGNSLTNALTVGFTGTSTASTNPQTLSVALGGESPQQYDLWYTPNTGTPIQITKNGIVNTTASSIPGESYAAGTFFWTQAQDSLPTTPANFDIGSITLRPNVAATSNGVVLGPPTSISSQYNVKLPLLPVATAFLTIDSSGNMLSTIPIANGITASNIANGTITTTQISPTAGITGGQLASNTVSKTNLVNTVFEWSSQAFNITTPVNSARAATTVNGTLASSFQNGSVIDGITLATNDVILIKNQTTSTQDGVYVVQASGAPVRSASYNTAGTITYAGIHITNGTVNANTNWFQNNLVSNLATDAQSWSESETSTFTVPTGVNVIRVLGCGGGGGGGGGGGATGGTGGAGGSGGAGATPIDDILFVTPGDTLVITVGFQGAGGAGGASSGGTGSAGSGGSNSTITGASGGVGTGSLLFPGASGGNGGIGTAGNGGAAVSTYAISVSGIVGAGGSGAGGKGNNQSPAATSADFTNYVPTPATGGSMGSGNGGGGGGSGFSAGGNGGNGAAGVANPGNSAGSTAYGAGGGGASGGGSGSVAGGAGGNGQSGQLILYWLAGGP